MRSKISKQRYRSYNLCTYTRSGGDLQIAVKCGIETYKQSEVGELRRDEFANGSKSIMDLGICVSYDVNSDFSLK